MTTAKPAAAAVEPDPEDMDRRVRIVAVPERALLHIFEQATNPSPPEFLNLPAFTKLPPGYRVLRVAHDFGERAFLFLVQHVEFSPVATGERVPVITSPWELRTTVYRREDPRPDPAGFHG